MSQRRTVRTVRHTATVPHTHNNMDNNLNVSFRLISLPPSRITISNSATALKYSSVTPRERRGYVVGIPRYQSTHQLERFPFLYSILSRITHMRLRCGWSVAACAADGSDNLSKVQQITLADE
jgi:hypothetical protein